MAKTKTTTKPKPSASDLLGALAGKTTAAKSKSKTPIIVVEDDAEIKQMVAICEAKATEKAAKAKSEMAQDKLRPVATAKFEAQCRDDNQLHSSIKLTADVGEGADKKTHSLTFTQKAQAKGMVKGEVEDELHTIFGDEYDDHFNAEQTITIDTGVLTNEQITAVILGIQKALKYTDDPKAYDAAIGVIASIVPKESFFRDRILDTDFAKLACRAAAEDLAVPHKPSFKL